MKRFVLALSILGLALPALAQDAGDDWDLTPDAHGVTLASLQYSNGGVAVRCADDSLDLILFGLPAAPEGTRALRVAFGDGVFYDQTWTAGPNGTAAFSELPARMARMLRAGGRLQVIASTAEGQPNRRLVFDLPRSAAAVDTVLTTCGKPLNDPRDGLDPWVTPTGLPAGRTWARAPDAAFPKQASDKGVERGYAVVSCVTGPAGRVEDCRVESEFPAGYRLGRAAVVAAHRSLMVFDRNDPNAGAGQVFAYRTTWYTKMFQAPPSRLRPDMPEMDPAAAGVDPGPTATRPR